MTPESATGPLRVADSSSRGQSHQKGAASGWSFAENNCSSACEAHKELTRVLDWQIRILDSSEETLQAEIWSAVQYIFLKGLAPSKENLWFSLALMYWIAWQSFYVCPSKTEGKKNFWNGLK